ncbi:hypothetical protein [Mangrovibacterium marinum]|uniref:hypothetical protein n=1 Tax=Mangrovibacterium marinum TaxID=1639118 RepID=UPI002A188E18|nr:hypothetical protein [Mangrovibacterium marinum]
MKHPIVIEHCPSFGEKRYGYFYPEGELNPTNITLPITFVGEIGNSQFRIKLNCYVSVDEDSVEWEQSPAGFEKWKYEIMHQVCEFLLDFTR